ncbi:class I SAM-dependent methyltransferase [Streptomyces roseirectus]|uniref:Class I SAM-dependent methyltransferase n=1 Tax=Streptomyces roseirectus TaxID=2768066 RepID=A0A7H0ILA7_9ACTN|nr:class I SAM-dependent methyltransferase [Streptomyces roseirectus]QNP73573.1 class I SAM-dependent methyltransferase [Streptomyces roseirectus]
MSDLRGGAVAGGVDWDLAAGAFDEEADHGLRDPEVRAAWADRMAAWLPPNAADVLDLGCGTGSLSLLAAERGHRVTGVDRSPAMLDLARAKLAAYDAEFLLGDAQEPPVGTARFDVVLVRHVLWALPDPARALANWRALLREGGRMVLVEGVWGSVTPVGIPAERVVELVEGGGGSARVERLDGDDRLWGGAVDDVRYVVVATV